MSASVDSPELLRNGVQAAEASARAVEDLLEAARLRQEVAELTGRAVDMEASALESAKAAEMFALQIREKRLMALEKNTSLKTEPTLDRFFWRVSN